MQKCSMQKKIESLRKKSETVWDGEVLTFSFDGVNVMVHEWSEEGEGRYVQEYTMDVRGSFNDLTGVINLIADKAIYDDAYKNPDNWTVLDVSNGSVTLSAATTQDENGDSDPDGNFIADFTVVVNCTLTKPAHSSEILTALSDAKIRL